MEKLSNSELNIMMKIWQANEPLYFEDIVELLKEYNWVESTIRNFLSRIIDKGYIKTKKDCRKNLYIPLVSQDYINKESRSLIEKLYDNSLKKFVVELYESGSLDYDDLLELKEYVDEKIDKRGE